MGWTIDQVYELTKIDKWFLAQMKELVDFEAELIEETKHWDNHDPKNRPDGAALLRKAKAWGYSDVQLANIWGETPAVARHIRDLDKVSPVYKLVDTCAAEFEAYTPYYYSTYETPYTVDGKPVTEDEIRLTERPKVIIIGGGPNRIGQGIEFDYCCVQAAFAMRELGLESVMINSNPETVSTDYDTSDLLFFEPLTHEDVLNICGRLNGGPFLPQGFMTPDAKRAFLEERAKRNLVQGVIVQFGGQTPLNLAKGLKEAGVPILGTTVESIDAAGDREQFRALLQTLNLKQPANGIARNVSQARDIAKSIGYPVLVRPSFVLGGRAMEIVSDEAQLNYYMANAVEASITDAPILIDKFLDNATEVDVDCLADFEPVTVKGFAETGEPTSAGLPPAFNGSARELLDAFQSMASPTAEQAERFDKALGGFTGVAEKISPPSQRRAIIIGVMEHIEEAGIHSGDSACALPPYSLSKEIVQRLKDQTRALAKALRVCGLMNVQYAIKDNEIYVIEVNPRASRTVPFVSKAHGIPWAKIAAKVMAGKTLDELGIVEPPPPKHTSVKEVVFPFSKFPGVDVILGPEMRSTGEVMGIDMTFPLAFAKSQVAAGGALPTKGRVFISVNQADKKQIAPIAKIFHECGFEIVASEGTLHELNRNDIPATKLAKLSEGRPNIADYIKNGQVQLILNTPTKKGPATDEGKIRSMAVLHKIPMITTLTGARAAAQAIQALQKGDWTVRPLQEYFGSK